MSMNNARNPNDSMVKWMDGIRWFVFCMRGMLNIYAIQILTEKNKGAFTNIGCWVQLRQSVVLAVRFQTLHPLMKTDCMLTHTTFLFKHFIRAGINHTHTHNSVYHIFDLSHLAQINSYEWNCGSFYANVQVRTPLWINFNSRWCDVQWPNWWTTLFKWLWQKFWDWTWADVVMVVSVRITG